MYGDLSRIFPTFVCNENNHRKNGNNERHKPNQSGAGGKETDQQMVG